MSEVAIAELLENDLAAYNLVVQVSQEDDCLLVMLNRPADSELDYPTLTEAIATRIHTLDLPDIHILLLCSRVLGEYDVDWETEIELIASRLELVPAITYEQEEISSEVESFVEESETIQAATPIISESTSQPETTITLETTIVESLVENSATPITSESTTKLESTPETTVETPETPALSEGGFKLSNYCFTRNQALITRKILPPDEKLAELVRFFHALSDCDKEAFLPLLEQLFRSAEPVAIEQLNPEIQHPEIQQWFEQFTQFQSAEIRAATIWFSRYCFNPEKTMAEVMEVIDFKAVKAAAVEESTPEQITLPDKIVETTPRRYSPTPTTRANAPAPRKTARATNKLLLPIAWTLFTIIAIAIAVRSVNPTEAVANACRNATGKQEYCRLAVQLVGELTFHEESQVAAPLTETDKEQGVEACERLGNIRAGKTLENSKDPVLSSSGEEVVPGIFIADVKQTNFKQAGATVRTACVFVNTKEDSESEDETATETPTKTQLSLVGSDIIPNNWSTEPYKGQPLAQEAIRKAFGIHNIFINIGAGTIFTAIGMFVAAMFSLGIRVDSLPALYRAAFCFGVIEAIGATTPLGWFGGIAFNVLGLGIISAFVRGFHVVWTEGYPMVAAGAIAIIAIKAVLNIGLLCLIAAFIG